nr:hypothetical protein [Mucilaginibacter sp. FT3.2]
MAQTIFIYDNTLINNTLKNNSKQQLTTQLADILSFQSGF